MGIKTSLFQVNLSADLDLVWQNLESAGCSLLYSDSSENSQQIFGHLPRGLKTKKLLSQYSELLRIDEIELPEIDWEAQWAAHGNYQNGVLTIDLKEYARQCSFGHSPSLLKLIPGPGFGDLSHPTTRLVLKLMPTSIVNQDVIDVGCGSGILSIAAVAMGARSVFGIDIDEQALIHSRKNSVANGMQNKIEFLSPGQAKKSFTKSVVLMNMIQSEQLVAWESVASTSTYVSEIVTSGILKQGRSDYLQLCKKWGWQLIEEAEEEDWLGFVFKPNWCP